MNDNDAIIFGILKKQLNGFVMVSYTINGAVVADKTVIAKILNKNQ